MSSLSACATFHHPWQRPGFALDSPSCDGHQARDRQVTPGDDDLFPGMGSLDEARESRLGGVYGDLHAANLAK
jgi:hypothetical protein